MTQNPALSAAEIEDALQSLSGWVHEDDTLVKLFEFSNFREAISFLVRVAFEAEARDHHPEISNVYNRVNVALTTHDAGNRVTGQDVELARAIDSFSWVE